MDLRKPVIGLALLFSLNVLALCVCVYFVVQRIQVLASKNLSPRIVQVRRLPPRPPSAPQTPPARAEQKPAPPEPPTKRNILFQYWDSTAKRVALKGDFADDKLQPMKKSGRNLWQISWEFAPGTYASVFIVNRLSYPDPNNPNRKEGKSLLTVPSKE